MENAPNELEGGEAPQGSLRGVGAQQRRIPVDHLGQQLKKANDVE
jgi:hypothetical protein